MTRIVRDDGFQHDDLPAASAAGSYRQVTLEELAGNDFIAATDALGLALPNDTDPHDVQPHFAKLSIIHILFPNFADGRGFSLARRLRLLGYRGRLRATGHLIADQYAAARRCGFDEIEISEALASRQPQAQWIERGNWDRQSYQDRLRRAV